MFRVAVVGSGYIAQNHLAALKSIESAKLVALIGRNAEKGEAMAREYGACFYTSLEAAKQDAQMDMVIICTPTDLHEDMVIRAAKLNCHVLCEKPVCFDTEAFDRMASACRENGVRFMVAQVARWWPEFMTVRKFIADGRLGNIHMITEKRLCQHPNWTQWHRDPQRSGGGLYDLNVHDIDYLCSIFGRPETLYANGWKSSSGCWNHVCTSLRWACGAKAQVETSLEMTGGWPFAIELRVVGDGGTLDYRMTAGVNINDGESGGRLIWYPAGESAGITVAEEQSDMFAAEILEFISGVREGREFAVTHDQNRCVLEVIEATRQSLEENKVVKL